MDFKDKELIIFDFDGTLIDSGPDLTQALNVMLANYNLEPLTIEEASMYIGNGSIILVERTLKDRFQTDKITEELFKEAFDIYFDAYEEYVCDKTYLYPGVLEALKYLDSKGYDMAICTNKPYVFIEPILDALSIKQYFKLWVGADSLPKQKPDALPLLHLAETLNRDIKKSVMVGDSKNDILAAQNAKMDSIGVSYGYNYNEDIANYNPTKVVDSFEELQELFKNE